MNTALLLKTVVTLGYNKVGTRTEEDMKTMDRNKHMKMGNKVEIEFLDYARLYLAGTHKLWLAASHSELDNGVKGDLVIELKPEEKEKGKKKRGPVKSIECLIIQIKSTKEQAIAHLERETVMGGKYRVPGVVWKDTPWNMVLQLRDVSGLPLNAKAEKLVDMATRLAGQTLPANYFPQQVAALTTLGFAKYSRDKREITFNADPPSLVFDNPIE